MLELHDDLDVIAPIGVGGGFLVAEADEACHLLVHEVDIGCEAALVGSVSVGGHSVAVQFEFRVDRPFVRSFSLVSYPMTCIFPCFAL